MRNVSESLAGRIAIIELGTLKANELFQEPLSDFYQLFKQPLCQENFKIESTSETKTSKTYKFEKSEDEGYYQEWMVNYETTYVNRDIARLFPKLDKIAFRRFITMLGERRRRLFF